MSIKTLYCTLQHLNKFFFVYATKSSKIKCEKEAAVRAACPRGRRRFQEAGVKRGRGGEWGLTMPKDALSPFEWFCIKICSVLRRFNVNLIARAKLQLILIYRNFWRESSARAKSNQSPIAYHPSALALHHWLTTSKEASNFIAPSSHYPAPNRYFWSRPADIKAGTQGKQMQTQFCQAVHKCELRCTEVRQSQTVNGNCITRSGSCLLVVSWIKNKK